jgi:uncharacterized protein YbjT (DUF2867 family)
MRVLVTGAYGLIGAACLARLYATGHDVVAAGRNIRGARRRFPFAQWATADFKKLTDAPAWLPLLQGVDAVVNCVGVLQDGLRDDVRGVQFEGTKALFDGCVRAGVPSSTFRRSVPSRTGHRNLRAARREPKITSDSFRSSG